MKSKLLVIIFLAILVVQPLVAFSGSLAYSTQAKPTRNFDSSQDAGSRLEPGEYTNHVPFVVNSTADFAVQGWPGSGTQGDPYVISGLNITTTIAAQCIQISYTDAYFVIRDCFLDTSSLGVFILNATHGRIEYTTVLSQSMGVYGMFSDNLEISHTHVEASGLSIQIIYCPHATVEWSVADCLAGMSLMVILSHYFTSTHNHLSIQSGGGMGIYIDSSNHSTSSFDRIETTSGAYGIYGTNSHYLSVSDLVVDTSDYGLFVAACPSSNFTRCIVSNSNVYGGFFASSPDVSVTDSTFYDSDSIGVMFVASNNSIFTNNIIEDSGIMGLQILDCDDVEAAYNVIVNIPTGFGIYIDDSHDLVLNSNTVENSDMMGIYIENSDRPSIIDTDVSNTGESGIYLGSSPNATITDCEVSNSYEYGIYADGCLNVSISGSQISDCGDEGISVQYSDNARIENNVIHDVEEAGIRSGNSDNVVISQNEVTQSKNGIQLFYSDDVTVDQNTVTDVMGWAVYLYYSDRAIVTTNTLDSAYENGIYVSFADDCVFDYNTMINCGFQFALGYAMNRYNHSMVGNTVNGKPVYYAYNQNGEIIAANSYGQIILLNCTFMEIADGTFNRVTTAVHLLYCEEVVIRDLVCIDNYRTLRIYNSDNVTVSDSVLQGRIGDQGIYSSYGLRLQIEDCSFSRFSDSSDFGVFLQNADYTTIANCSFDYNFWGVRWSSTDYVTVADCTILNSVQYGINGWGSTSDYPVISGNTILNATRGFYSSDNSQGIITGNTIMYCIDSAIYLAGTTGDQFNITLNTIENNYDGIYSLSADDHFIMNNTVRWNSHYGVRLSGSDNTEVYYNLIALNGFANGIDSRSGNYWDDGVDTGNTWDDYTPPGDYDVDGNTDDRYATQYLPTNPIINEPQDIFYDEGTTGNELVWHPFDDSLSDWQVTIDGVLWESDAWNFVDITVIVDDLAYGVHIAVVTVWDIHSNSVSDTVEINVVDETDPTINGPANTLAFVDGTGQSLTWEVSDLHPGQYEVLVDDVVTESGTWTTGTVTGSIDGLTEGIHVVQLLIYDLDGNYVVDGVLVEVVDDNAVPTIDSPDDMEVIEGTTGNQIIWSPADDYPDTFVVSYNGSTFVSDSWGGSRITVLVDGLTEGVYSFSLTVYDGSGNSASDQVVVTVLAVEGTTTPLPPVDVGLLLIIGAIAGTIVVVVVVIYILKKRS